ncbi:Protein of unknown function (DUF3710) [Nocardia amikacinitolerans]|uniref:DUF3710 domain-containing protein n=1 Tax=Nocardia amikacinitolerans TaxID=756689 RepID=UPI000836E5BA|nr:DUF3710 domain-containing protein [Nocardia amikacinitolerans]MCP2316049.1 Protein of unknown function (DUF3710) [Nocardia amikacinitolerans]
MFGKRKKRSDRFEDQYDEYGAEYDDVDYDAEYDELSYDEFAEDTAGFAERKEEGERTGPYDYDEVAELLEGVVEQRLDLGSVILPVPPGGQLQVEMTPDGTPQAVHLATEHGRITVAAYAAPKSPGQWRAVAADLADSLRKDGARVAVETGPWGREVLAITEGADLRFIGVDGYRWMVRLVAAGPSGAANDGAPLVAAARAILSETVIRRGTDPLPVRDPLPVVLPQQLAEQLAAAHQAQIEAQQQQMAAQAAGVHNPVPAQPQTLPPQPRRGADGSAMQQLGLN